MSSDLDTKSLASSWIPVKYDQAIIFWRSLLWRLFFEYFLSATLSAILIVRTCPSVLILYGPIIMNSGYEAGNAGPPKDTRMKYVSEHTKRLRQRADSHSYLCADCGAVNQIQPKEVIRCRSCGHRVMYKEVRLYLNCIITLLTMDKRTKRMVQFLAI